MNLSVENEPLIRVKNLHKKFGSDCAAAGIDLELYAGHIIGLVGPNSGGKSTLLRHILGIYLPDSGTVEVRGINAADIDGEMLAQIGYVAQEAQLLNWMRAGELIRYVAAHYSTWNIELEERFVEIFELDLRKRVGLMSPGQRQKLSILLAIGFEPKLLILDEPASALDPVARKIFLELLMEIIQEDNRTVIISSHILSDIEKVIDHVIVMDQGRLLRNSSFDDLQEEFVRLSLVAVGHELPAVLPIRNMLSCEQDTSQAVVVIKRDAVEPAKLAEELNCRVSVEQLSFEEIYPLVLNEANNVKPSN